MTGRSESLPMMTPTIGASGICALSIHDRGSLPSQRHASTPDRLPAPSGARSCVPDAPLCHRGADGRRRAPSPASTCARAQIARDSANDVLGHRPGRSRLGASERKIEHRAQMLFELRGRRAFDRKVTRIVRTRRNFIDQQIAHPTERTRPPAIRPLRNRRQWSR